MPKHTNKKNPKEESESEPEEEEEEDEEEEEIDLSALPKNVFRRVKAVRMMHTEVFEKIESEYEKERLALEKKFEAKKNEFYTKRNPIIMGEVDVPKVEGAEEEGTEETEDKGIPNFWITVLSSHPAIGEVITEEDVPALEALNNVTCSYDEEFTSFTLTFHFAENDFFTNKTLTKRYVVAPNLLDEKNPNLSEVEGSTIDWKPTKNLCVTEVKKKQKAKSGRNKGQVRTVVRTEPKASFFHYFDEHKEDGEDEEEEEEEDEEQHGKTKFSPEEDYDIGHTIRTTLIPEAILWFTGEAHVDDFDFDDEDEDEEDGEEEDEDEDEEDDEEEDKKATKGKKSKGFAAPAAPGAPGAAGQQPECKQN